MEREEILSILQCTRGLLAKPINWVQSTSYVSVGSLFRSIEPRTESAYCLLGAINKCATNGKCDEIVNERTIPVANAIVACVNPPDCQVMAGDVPSWRLVSWNDHPNRNYEEVIEALDRTIESLSS